MARQPRGRGPGLLGARSVSELTSELKSLIEGRFAAVRVQGEVLSARAVSSGHLYFTLKDQGAQLPCVMWRSTLARLPLRIRDGMQVVASGDVQVYPPHGRYQLIVRGLSDVGLGELLAQREILRRTLAAEGLFSPERKRPLPLLPRRIGVVTAATGAAVRDILTTIRGRYPAEVVVYPCRVQGRGAAAAIARGVRTLGALADVDVIIAGRGGGSLEDLWAFEEEEVIRAIAASPVPVVSAVGHETDHPLSDDAADVRAPTPTAAGELVVPSLHDLRVGLRHQRDRLAAALGARLRASRQRLDARARRLTDPHRLVAERQQTLDDATRRLGEGLDRRLASARQRWTRASARLRNLHPRDTARSARAQLAQLDQRLTRAMRQTVSAKREKLVAARHTLTVLSPAASLERGYAIARRQDGRVLRDAAQLDDGAPIEIILHRGAIDALVTARRPRNAYETEEP